MRDAFYQRDLTTHLHQGTTVLTEDQVICLPEENGQRKGDPSNDNPGHEAVKVGLDEAGSNLLDLEGEDEPLGQVEQEEKNGDLAARL